MRARIPHWRWLVESALAATGLALARIAAQPVAQTPIDTDLPLVGLLIIAWAWAARDSQWVPVIEMAAPLLALPLLAFGQDDRMRLAAFGVIAAGAFALAAVHAKNGIGELGALVVGAMILLRWFPLTSVEILRESIVLAGTLLLFHVLGGFGRKERAGTDVSLVLTASLAVGLVTPIHPGRAIVFPFLVALLVFLISRRGPFPRRSGEKDLHTGDGSSWRSSPPRIEAALREPHAQTGVSVPHLLATRLWGKREVVAAILAVVAFVAAYAGRSSKGPLFAAAGLALLVTALLAQTSLPGKGAAFLSGLHSRRGSSSMPSAMSLLSSAILFMVVAVWPWSGVVARALPLVVRFEPPGDQRIMVGYALAASESKVFDLPARRRHVVVTASGANASRMRPGRLLGTIEADGTPSDCRRSIRIGDVADFGFDRSAEFFASRNPLPRRSEWDLRDYGIHAWVHGAGRVSLGCRHDIASLRITAAPDLPPDARLQIESIETAPR